MFNKKSKAKTGGGPYEEMVPTKADELIISASGLEASVEGLSNTKTFDASTSSSQVQDDVEYVLSSFPDGIDVYAHVDDVEEFELPFPKNKNKQNKCDPEIKTKMIEETVQNQKDLKNMIESKLGQIINIQRDRSEVEKSRLENEKKMLAIKEEKLKVTMDNNKMYLEMKCSQLEILKMTNDINLQKLNSKNVN